MIRWKVRLHPMHHRLAKCLMILLICLMAGCSKSAFTQMQWFTQISMKGGFSVQESTALDDLNDFGLLDVYSYSLDDLLTYQTVLDTCDALLGEYESLQLLQLLECSSMDKKDVLTQQQAEILLDWLIEEINSFDKVPAQSILYLKEPVKVTVFERSEDWVRCDQLLQLHDLVDVNGVIYEVLEVHELWIRIGEADYENVSEIDVSGSMKLDLNDAQITVRNEIVDTDEVLKAGTPAFSLSKTFEIQGFKIRFSTSSDSLHIYASKKMQSGLPIFVQFDINEVNCDFKWKADRNKIQEAAMKVSYETSLTSGLRTSQYKDRILDFSKLDQSQLMNSVRNAFVPQSDCLSETIEIAEIQLPFPDMPVCVLKMKVFLHLYASGKAEIAFESNQVIGFEKLDGNLRLIHETEKDSQVSLRASGKASTQLQFMISILAKDCMDASAELGIEGEAVTKLAMTETGEVLNSDISYELAEELAQSSEKLMACADLDAHWMLKLILNSQKSLLGSLGLGKTLPLIDESNGSLFGKTVHLENFQRVDQCTRKLRSTPLPTIDVSSDRIELKHYLLILDEKKSGAIVISSLPQGAEISDVVFSSVNPHIATVDSNGIVSAVQSGQTIIKIALKDGTHEVQCSIFVR